MSMSRKLLRPKRRLSWLLFDTFTTDDSAPVASPRTCQPGPGTLTFTQTDGGYGLSGGIMTQVAQTTAAWGDLGAIGTVGGNGFARTLGRMLVFALEAQNVNDDLYGWRSTTTPTALAGSFDAARLRTNVQRLAAMTELTAAAETVTGEVVLYAMILRAAGVIFLMKRPSDASWRLMMVVGVQTYTPCYPWIGGLDGTPKFSWFGVPDVLWFPPPLAGDSFDGSDSSDLGSTDGAGGEETGGSGVLWADLTGDPQIASNAFCASASADTAAVLDVAKSDVVITAVLTARASGPGIVFRAVDSDNYFRAAVDGSNIKIWERTSGSWTERASAAAGTSNGTDYFACLTLEGTAIRFVVNQVAVTYTSSVRQSATKHGVFSPAVNATVKAINIFNRFQSTFPAVE